jgi:predicted nucleic acid-binding Zn ribbon protein
MTLSAWRRDAESARPIGDIAKALLRRKKFHEKGKFGALVSAWGAVVGEGVAARTNIRSFKDGNLVIEVDSPVLLHELCGFMKQQLLLGLQATEAGRDVAQIRLCLGLSQSGRKSKEAEPTGP